MIDKAPNSAQVEKQLVDLFASTRGEISYAAAAAVFLPKQLAAARSKNPRAVEKNIQKFRAMSAPYDDYQRVCDELTVLKEGGVSLFTVQRLFLRTVAPKIPDSPMSESYLQSAEEGAERAIKTAFDLLKGLPSLEKEHIMSQVVMPQIDFVYIVDRQASMQEIDPLIILNLDNSAGPSSFANIAYGISEEIKAAVKDKPALKTLPLMSVIVQP